MLYYLFLDYGSKLFNLNIFWQCYIITMSQPLEQMEIKQVLEPSDTLPPEGEKEKKEGQIQQPVTEAEKEEVQPVSEMFIEKNLQLSQEIKGEGNTLFKEEQFGSAIKKYQQALSFTPKEEQQLRSVLYSNIAICHAKQLNFQTALAYCKKSAEQDPTYAKAQLNLAIYFQKTDELEEALAQNKKLLELYPKDVKIMIKIKELEKKIEEKTEAQKKEVIDGLKNIGNSVLGYFGLSLDNFKLEQGTNGGYNVSFKQ